jgi:hypothetical protein
LELGVALEHLIGVGEVIGSKSPWDLKPPVIARQEGEEAFLGGVVRTFLGQPVIKHPEMPAAILQSCLRVKEGFGRIREPLLLRCGKHELHQPIGA